MCWQKIYYLLTCPYTKNSIQPRNLTYSQSFGPLRRYLQSRYFMSWFMPCFPCTLYQTNRTPEKKKKDTKAAYESLVCTLRINKKAFPTYRTSYQSNSIYILYVPYIHVYQCCPPPLNLFAHSQHLPTFKLETKSFSQKWKEEQAFFFVSCL